MKTISYISVLILLQSSSTVATKIRQRIQSRMINHF